MSSRRSSSVSCKHAPWPDIGSLCLRPRKMAADFVLWSHSKRSPAPTCSEEDKDNMYWSLVTRYTPHCVHSTVWRGSLGLTRALPTQDGAGSLPSPHAVRSGSGHQPRGLRGGGRRQRQKERKRKRASHLVSRVRAWQESEWWEGAPTEARLRRLSPSKRSSASKIAIAPTTTTRFLPRYHPTSAYGATDAAAMLT